MKEDLWKKTRLDPRRLNFGPTPCGQNTEGPITKPVMKNTLTESRNERRLLEKLKKQ